MISEKMISVKCLPRAESSALAGCWCAGRSTRPMLRWIVAGLFGMFALPGLGWAQTTLRTPSADDSQCLERDCSAVPRASEGNADPTTGNARNQAGTTPRPAESMPNDSVPNNNNNNDEQGQYGEPARHPKLGFPLKTDAVPAPP